MEIDRVFSKFLRKASRKTGVTPAVERITSSHPNGHFYSPVTDPADLANRQDEIWQDPPPPCLGIDFNDDSHRQILGDWFPRHIGHYDYPEFEGAEGQYYTRNSQFGWLDSRALFVMIRELRPSRVIEVGSGFSSLLTADVNHRFLGDSAEFTCIEPYPRKFLEKGIPGLGQLMVQRVETVELDFFESLAGGDVLFIDSSHVSKTGSDVNYLVFQVLPRLPAGVLIHFHDIFLPFEYPTDWAIGENRSWNEQYLLRALLMDSKAYKVVFGCSYAHFRFPDLVASGLGGKALSGSSFWLEKIG